MPDRRQFLRYSLLLAGAAAISTASTGCAPVVRRAELSQARFDHGVASGDPLPDGIVLWTRATLEGAQGRVKVAWELAEDRDFQAVLRRGVLTTDASRDYTVKVDVRELKAGRDYFYRFLGVRHESAVGRARTLAADAVERVRLAVFSCANYPAGYFHAYREASRLQALDASLHLGDYLYEYGMGGYATERAQELGRTLPADNAGELLTLDDYRRRYALYRRDPDLQAIHAAAPMIAVWDDHEIANDAWVGGAQNHDAAEGDYQRRAAAAVRAYFEWMPLRPLRADAQGRIYRGFDFGDLLSLHMLDTRLVGRDRQLEYAEFVDPSTGAVDPQALQRALADPRRNLLGDQQWRWLRRRLENSPGRWQVLGQQILMARMLLPAELVQGLFADRDFSAAAPVLEELTQIKAAALRGTALSERESARLRAALPYNLDAWDGYPAERERLFAAAAQAGRQLVVLSGDTHNSWFSELHDSRGRSTGVELATPGVSSPGMESYLGLRAGEADRLARSLPQLIDDLRFCELTQRGFLQLDFDRDALQATWHYIDDVTRRSYRTARHQVTVAHS